MFCGKCGNKVSDSAKFCSKCGNAIVGRQKEAKNKPVQWLESYVERWKSWREMQKNQQYIWFGIHGGIILLLFLIIRAGTGSNDAEKYGDMVVALVEDGEFDDEDIAQFAQEIDNYEDLKVLRASIDELWQNEKLSLDTNVINAVNGLEYDVVNEINSQSEFGQMVSEKEYWHDENGLIRKLSGKNGLSEYVKFYPYDISVASYDDRSNLNLDPICRWYFNKRHNMIEFVAYDYDLGEEQGSYLATYREEADQIVILFDGKEYHLREADADMEEEKKKMMEFSSVAVGIWNYSDAFYEAVCSYLDSYLDTQEKSEERPAKYFVIRTDHICLWDGNGAMTWESEWVNCEQGEGQTVILSKNGQSLEVSYRRQGNVLIFTVDGVGYSLTKADDNVE